MMINKTRIQKGTKKFLSVVLAVSVLIPSMLNGTMSYTTYAEDLFSDQSTVENNKFTDKVEENKNLVNIEEVPEAFSDGEELNIADGTASSIQQPTVTIETNDQFRIGSQDMFDMTNEHDGSLTISKCPEIVGNPNELHEKYSCVYGQGDHVMSWSDAFCNPESDSGIWLSVKNEEVTSIDDNYDKTKIEVTNVYTFFCVVTEEKDGLRHVANMQYVENPVKVSYDLKGGNIDGDQKLTGDWVWTRDNRWKTDPNTVTPTKTGYKFAGWYANNKGTEIKINNVEAAVDNAAVGEHGYKEITLYPKWIHEQHNWNYIQEADGKVKAYCSNSNSPCEYYDENNISLTNYAELSLGVNGSESNEITYSGTDVKAEIKSNTIVGATISEITYKKYNAESTKYESMPENQYPVNAGKYRAEVSVDDEKTAYVEYEITKAPITLSVKLDDYTYGTSPSIQVQVTPSDSIVAYQYKRQDNTENPYIDISEDGFKSLSTGEYTLKAIVGETENYNGTHAECSFTVCRANATNSDSKVNIKGWTYGSYNASENAPSIDSGLNPNVVNLEST